MTVKAESYNMDMKAFLNIRRYLFPPFILMLRTVDLENALKKFGLQHNNNGCSGKKWLKEESIISKNHTGFGKSIIYN